MEKTKKKKKWLMNFPKPDKMEIQIQDVVVGCEMLGKLKKTSTLKVDMK